MCKVLLILLCGIIHSTFSLQCEYYNETICKKPSARCDTEKLVNCEEYNGTKNCFVIWGNNTQGSVAVKFKGCFSGDKTCGDEEQCVYSGKFKADRFFCCCNGNMCNKEFYWHPTPEPPPESYSSSEIIPRNVSVIILMVFLPVVVICVLTISVVYRRHKHLYLKQVATSDAASECSPSAEEETLGPINLKELKAKGRFGCVWKAEYKGELVAVKIFSFQHKQSWSTELEIYKLPLINHENILHFIGVEKRPDELEYWLVTSYHENGSLYDYLKANTITWEQLCHISYTMMKGLSHLHEEIRSRKDGIYKPAIAHRDFKSSNVLLKDDLTACIADFGLAVIFKHGHTDDRGHAQVGTARYMAPEVLVGAVNINKDSFLRIDMYSCGLVLWELLSRCSTHGDYSTEFQLPFEKELGQHPSLNDLQDLVVHNKKRPVLKDTWRSHVGLSSLCDTIEECWDEDTDSRLSAPCVMERIAWYVRPSTVPAKPVVINNLSEG